MSWLEKSLVVLGCVMSLGVTACLAADPVGPDHAAGQAVSVRSWALKLPKGEKVVFSGANDYLGASASQNSMLYPAPNAAVFLVSVITHGLIVESQKNSQRKKAQETADKVLDPYQPILSTFSYHQLAQPWVDSVLPGSSRKLVGETESPGSNDWLMEITPVFLMAQSQRTLILDALVTIRAPGASDVGYQGNIRVISPTEEIEDPTDTWMADQGKKLKETSAWLFSESLNIAMTAAITGTGKAEQPFRTIRYLEGTTEKMERAQQISEHCGRLVIRTLRGLLMSVPTKASTSSDGNTPDMACAKG